MSFEAAVGPLGNRPVVGTIGTIISVAAHAISSGTISFIAPTPVTIGSVGAVSYQSLTTSATLSSAGGNLWGYELTAETIGIFGSVAATLVMFNYGAASGNGTIIDFMVAPPEDWSGIALARPRAYATLVASILGTGRVMISYE